MGTFPRESKYKPEYCQMLVDHMSAGLSYESFGGIVNVGKQTMYDWEKVHPEWVEAKRIASNKCLVFWEKLGLEGMFRGSKDMPFQPSMWNFNMSARFKWSMKNENSVTVSRLEDLLGADVVEAESVPLKIEHDENTIEIEAHTVELKDKENENLQK